MLDFIFKPKFGASLQHLKVEIGGGENSTDGSEPSHAITREELTHPKARGYEFWLMAEARKRNPKMLLDCLPWCYPGWLSGRFSQDSADWLVAFLDVARQQYGLEIDWLAAGQNEMGTDPKWIVKTLRPTLDTRGYSRVKLQWPDNNYDNWKIFDDLRKDPKLDAAVQAVGYHYLSSWLPKLDDDQRAAPSRVKATGKPLWVSEEFSTSGKTWASALLAARLINKYYIRDRVTKCEIWCPIDSIYGDSLPWYEVGLMRASTPWSGHYEVWPAVWAVAHTTQFAEPGWRCMDRACGRFDAKTWKGSYVALRNPASGDWSLIICTDNAAEVSVRIAEGLKQGPVHVWKSKRSSAILRAERRASRRRRVHLALVPHALYSLTTTTGQHKGAYVEPPPSKSFPFPFREDFESYRPGDTPKYFSDQKGTFEVARRPNGGLCLKQIVPREGICWFCKFRKPYTLLGDDAWRDYAVQANVLIVAGDVELGGRFGNVSSLDYRWILGRDGAWKLNYQDRVLASGSLAHFDASRWHTLKLVFDGPRIHGFIDGRLLADTQDTTRTHGMAYLATTHDPNCFDNVSVVPVGTEDDTPDSP